MQAMHVLIVLSGIVLGCASSADAVTGSAAELETGWVTKSCDGTALAREGTLDAVWSLDPPSEWLGWDIHLSVDIRERKSVGALRALDTLAESVAGASLLDDVRATVDVQVEAVFAARAALVAGAPIDALEQRLADLVRRLKDLETTLVGVIVAVPNASGADALLTPILLTQASGDFLDGLRYLAGRVRLYGRGTLRGECAAILWRAADAACSGELMRASGVLAELRRILEETSPAAFQRSSLGTAVSRIDSLCSDGPVTQGSAIVGASGDASWPDVSTEWEVGLTRESGTVPTVASTEMAWAVSGTMDVSEAQIDAAVGARRVGHDDAAARDDDVRDTSAEARTTFAVGETDGSVGILIEQQRYPLQLDREIPASCVAAAARGISDLLAEVARLGLSAAVCGRLTLPLTRAQLALLEGRTADAVTALGQFCAQVWKEAFGGALGESAAVSLAAAADRLLPRREETTWTASASVSGALAGWTGTADAEWVRRAAPGDSLVERVDGVASLSGQRAIDGMTLSVDGEVHCVNYPADAVKGYRQSQFAIGVSSDEEDLLEVGGGADWTSTFYALDSRKDRRDAELALDVLFAGMLWEWALSASRTEVVYPNDPGRDERAGAWEIAGRADVGDVAIELAWTSTWRSTVPGQETGESVRIGLDAVGEPIEVHVAAEAEKARRIGEGGACRWSLAWEVGIAVEF